VTRPGDELAPSVEEGREVGGHLVEGARELDELGGTSLGRARGEVAGGEGGGRRPEPVDSARDQAREEQRRDHRGRGGRGRDGQDLDVVAHVEHDPSGQEDGRERQHDGEEGEPGELRANSGKNAESESDDQADRERGQRDEDRELDHGVNL
jgi:hypothetical protein